MTPSWKESTPSGSPSPQIDASLGRAAEGDKKPNFIEFYKISRGEMRGECDDSIPLQQRTLPTANTHHVTGFHRRAVGIRSNREAAARFALRLDTGKMDVQLIANEEK